MLHHRTSTHCILLASFNERIGSKNLTNQNCCKAVNIADTLSIHWWLMAEKTSKALSTIHPKMTQHIALETSCFMCAKQYQASHGVNANVCPGQQRRKVRNKIGLKANICHHHYLSQLRNIYHSKLITTFQGSMSVAWSVSVHLSIDYCNNSYKSTRWKLMQATQARIFSASLVGTKSPENFVCYAAETTRDAVQTCPVLTS